MKHQISDNPEKSEMRPEDLNKFMRRVSMVSSDIAYLYNIKQHRPTFSNKKLDVDAFLNSIHPEDLPRTMLHRETLLHSQNDDTFQLECRIRSKDGTYSWFCICEQVYQRDDTGQPELLFGIAREITEDRVSEGTLRANEVQYREIFQNSLVGMFQTTPESRFINVNTALARIFGYDSPKELMSNIQNIQRQLYVNPRDRDLTDDLVKKDGILRNHEVQCRHVNGSIIWIAVNIRKVTDDQGRTLYNEGSVQDITERMLAEDALRQSEEKFKNLFDNAQVGMFRTRIDGSAFLDLNDKYLSILGVTREEIVGKSSMDYWADTKEREEMVKILNSKGNVDNFECRLITKDNRTITCLTSCRLYHDQGILEGSIVDITAHKRMVEELQKAQKLEALGLLASGIAHDFNNLMGGIFGYINLASEESSINKMKSYLSKAMNTLDRARGLTGQLLTFAKGGAPLKKITPLVSFLNDTAQFALSGSNVSCCFEIDENLWPCNIDKNMIGQVIDNIVINAQQSMPAGGTISMGANNVSLNEKDHSTLPAGAYVRISVKDSGTGIPGDILPRIFEPFFTTKTKGHGLGLATSYSIINRHGGIIDVQSQLGKGSTFFVYLPASKDFDTSEKGIPCQAFKGTGTILVMDDQAVIRETVSNMLSSLGYSVVCKDNGKDTIDYFVAETMAKRKIAGMILDLTVPGGMGGKETIHEIRKLDRTIPVIVSSGYFDDPVIADPAAYGFMASIRKPFTKGELSEILSKILR
jgi:PAS domain S-box-containing protein